MKNYDEFISAKTKRAQSHGFDPMEMTAPLFPWQRHVVEWAVMLWSNPGDLVYSPFAGIGSEGVGALTLDRRFIGSELKESYFKQACGNLRNAKAQLQLF